MQLSKLNSAIRATPKVKARFAFGEVILEKTSLLDALKAHFDGARTAETGLAITDDGYLQFTSFQQVGSTGLGGTVDWVQPTPADEPANIEPDIDEALGRNDDDDLSSLA